MSVTDRSIDDPRSVALVAEYPPPAAGMTVQAEMLRQRLQASGYRVVAVRSNPRLPARLQRARGIRGLLRWIGFLWQCRWLRYVGVVHVFACSGLSFVLFAVPPVILGRLLGRRVVVHYHGGAAAEFARRHPRLLRRTLGAADDLVVPSGFLHAVFADLGLPARIIGNPTDLERFRCRSRRDGAPVVLSCRNLEPVYDVATSLRAFACLRHRHAEARLLLAGDGSQRAALEALARELGIDAATSFLGNVPSRRMPDLLARAWVLINSPRIDNLPGSILEAFAAGVPVVSTDAGGIPWLVQDDRCGLLAPVGHWRRLGEHLVRVVENPALAQRLAACGEQVAAGYSWPRIEPLWRAVYAGSAAPRAA